MSNSASANRSNENFGIAIIFIFALAFMTYMFVLFQKIESTSTIGAERKLEIYELSIEYPSMKPLYDRLASDGEVTAIERKRFMDTLSASLNSAP